MPGKGALGIIALPKPYPVDGFFPGENTGILLTFAKAPGLSAVDDDPFLSDSDLPGKPPVSWQ
jgi:hypothetical protein